MFKVISLILLLSPLNYFSIHSSDTDPENQPLRSTPSISLDSPVIFTNRSIFRTRTSTAPVAPVRITTYINPQQAYELELDRKLKKRTLRYTFCSCITGLLTGWIVFHAKAK